MVRAATAAEEEYKDTLSPYAGAPAPVHPSMIDQYSLIGHDPSKPACDGPSVHLLVLHVEPATLQASTLISSTRDASADRSPPAANLLQPVKEWSRRGCSRGPSARLISLLSHSSHISRDRHSSRIRVPPHIINASTRPAQGARMNTAPPHEADRRRRWREPRATWILAGTSGESPSPDRHTPGTHRHMRLDTLAHGHARARTRSRTQGVEAAQMRLRNMASRLHK